MWFGSYPSSGVTTLVIQPATGEAYEMRDSRMGKSLLGVSVQVLISVRRE